MSKNQSVNVAGEVVAPGERSTVFLPVANLYTHTELSVPVHIICGRAAGPVVYLTGALHGDELNGIEIVKHIVKRTSPRVLRGTIIALPVVNVFGFINRSRYLPDRRDLNRLFPGRDSGSIGARLANLIAKEVVAKSNFGIDLHTGAINRTNLPQIRADLSNAQASKLAHAFAAPIVIDAAQREGSLRQYASAQGVPTIVYESGEALRFDELSIRVGVKGIRGVLTDLDMLPVPKRARDPVEPRIAHSTNWVRAPISGVFRTKRRLGDAVDKGQQLGSLSDPFSETDVPVLAPVSGIVIGRSTAPLMYEGDALFHIARLGTEVDGEGAVDALQETHSVEYVWG